MTDHERNVRFLFLMHTILPNYFAHTPDEAGVLDFQTLPSDQQKNLLNALERIHINLEGKR